jgi:hypothetical protein
MFRDVVLRNKWFCLLILAAVTICASVKRQKLKTDANRFCGENGLRLF